MIDLFHFGPMENLFIELAEENRHATDQTPERPLLKSRWEKEFETTFAVSKASNGQYENAW